MVIVKQYYILFFYNYYVLNFSTFYKNYINYIICLMNNYIEIVLKNLLLTICFFSQNWMISKNKII